MADNTKHFEDVWMESEQLSKTKYKDTQASAIIDKIKALLDSYDTLNTFAETADIRQSLKTQYMGEMIFLISALSYRDDINVWGALTNEIIKPI